MLVQSSFNARVKDNHKTFTNIVKILNVQVTHKDFLSRDFFDTLHLRTCEAIYSLVRKCVRELR